MHKKYWHQKWQFNEIGFNQKQPNELMRQYFDSLNLKQSSRVFVPLCGKSIDMLWLANKGYHVVGVELSPIACEAFFIENNISFTVMQSDKFMVFKSDTITLLSGDFFDLNKSILGTVNAVFDRAALVALPSKLRRRYVESLINLLEPATLMFLIVVTYEQNMMNGPPFSVSENEVTELYGDYFSIKQLYDESAEKISKHLQAKGLTQASEQVYYLISNHA